MADVHVSLGSYKAPPAALAATTSPQVAHNSGGGAVDVIVTGGTVSVIELSRDGATYYDTGLTTGIVSLSPGDYLRVTYSVAPTMTMIHR